MPTDDSLKPEFLYDQLLQAYGPSGWWPLRELAKKNPEEKGYHPGDYSWPRSRSQRFEISVGAILTQNTTWKQVERCLEHLDHAGLLDPEKMNEACLERVESLVKPSGYFRQKARKVKFFTRFFLEADPGPPLREDLLNLWGVGPETADSILLYAYGKPVFVIDAYTRRFVERLQGVPAPGYGELQARFSQPFLAMDPQVRAIVFSEFHALLVSHATLCCRARPRCGGCLFRTGCFHLEGAECRG